MIARNWGIVCLAIVLMLPAAAAHAKDHDITTVGVGSAGSKFHLEVTATDATTDHKTSSAAGGDPEADTSGEPGHYVTMDVCNVDGIAGCGDTCPDGSIKTVTYFLPEVGQPTDF